MIESALIVGLMMAILAIGALLTVHLQTLRREIDLLRKWRHTIGDEPYAACAQLYEQLERRIDRLEDGHSR
jgi:hypothetical protein